MRYAMWVPKVFHPLAEASRDQRSVGLDPVGRALGFKVLTWEAFANQTEPGRALMAAMYDLHELREHGTRQAAMAASAIDSPA